MSVRRCSREQPSQLGQASSPWGSRFRMYGGTTSLVTEQPIPVCVCGQRRGMRHDFAATDSAGRGAPAQPGCMGGLTCPTRAAVKGVLNAVKCPPNDRAGPTCRVDGSRHERPYRLDSQKARDQNPKCCRQIGSRVLQPGISEAHMRPSSDAGAFFSPHRWARHLPVYGGRCAGAARLAGSSELVCKPRTVRHHVLQCGGGHSTIRGPQSC